MNNSRQGQVVLLRVLGQGSQGFLDSKDFTISSRERDKEAEVDSRTHSLTFLRNLKSSLEEREEALEGVSRGGLSK